MSAAAAGRAPRAGFPWHGWLGLVLTACCWGLNWTLPGLRTHLLFFPQWLGYCLAVDAWVVHRTGTSLVTRGVGRFVLLFVLSAPAWWLFEAINLRTHNWVYLGREAFTDLQYFLLSSWAFCTVMPAVFETAELVRSFLPGVQGGRERAPLALPWRAPAMLIAGLVGLAAVLVAPRLFFPLVWVCLWLVLEPVNGWLGFRTLLAPAPTPTRRTVVSLMLGALGCGLFWELWNWRSYPKWIYMLPYADWLHVFEMPVAGYAGYLPFSLELFALYQLGAGLIMAALPGSDRLHLDTYVLPAHG